MALCMLEVLKCCVCTQRSDLVHSLRVVFIDADHKREQGGVPSLPAPIPYVLKFQNNIVASQGCFASLCIVPNTYVYTHTDC